MASSVSLGTAQLYPGLRGVRRPARGWAAWYTAHRRSVDTRVYTCVVEIEACPSSSCTARMSAPRFSMWVAHECRSTCGLSRSPSPTRSPCLRTIPHAPWRDRRPPRALRNTASASPRRAHRSGASARPAAGVEPRLECLAGEAAQRDDAVLAALPERAEERAVEVDVGEGQADQLRDAQPRSVQHLEDRSIAAGDGIVAGHGADQGVDLGLVERLRQALGIRGAATSAAGSAVVISFDARNRCSPLTTTRARLTDAGALPAARSDPT